MKYIVGALIFFLISCKKEVEAVAVKEHPVEGVSLFDEKQTFVFKEELKVAVREKIKNWDEYFVLSDFLKKNYTHISPSLSLEMSKELSVLVKAMNDSLRIKELNNRPVYARLNTLNSEVLRLKDMSTISSIKAAEVNLQVEKVVAVYGAINSKINSVYSQHDFDENVNFDEAIFNFNEQEATPYLKSKKKKRGAAIQRSK